MCIYKRYLNIIDASGVFGLFSQTFAKNLLVQETPSRYININIAATQLSESLVFFGNLEVQVSLVQPRPSTVDKL